MVRVFVILMTSAAFGVLAACGPWRPPAGTIDSSSVETAFEHQENNVQVGGEGVVARILADDSSGIPHQRFILKLPSGHTVLIEHNTDLAPRISGLKEGDAVFFSGEYIWNQQGGLIHWTHHDPAGRHPSGWLKHNGQTYQ